MSSPAAAGDVVLPALPPIRTVAASSRTSVTSTAPAEDPKPMTGEKEVVVVAGKGKEKEAEAEAGAEPTTPKSEESRLRTPSVCPPAPRKPARASTLVKRKSLSSSSAPLVFFPVPRDLSAVFRSLPPKKRIRAG